MHLDPVPGGCGFDAAVSTEVMTKKIDHYKAVLLSYWTSLLSFKASALFLGNGTVYCPSFNDPFPNLTYHVYASALVTAGDYFNVSTDAIGTALEEMSDYQANTFKGKHFFKYKAK